MIYLGNNVYLKPYHSCFAAVPHNYTVMLDDPGLHGFPNFDDITYIGEKSIADCMAMPARTIIYAQPKTFNNLYSGFLRKMVPNKMGAINDLIRTSLMIRYRNIEPADIYPDFKILDHYLLLTDSPSDLGNFTPGVEWLILREKLGGPGDHSPALKEALSHMYRSTLMSQIIDARIHWDNFPELNDDLSLGDSWYTDPLIYESSDCFESLGDAEVIEIAKDIHGKLPNRYQLVSDLAIKGKKPTTTQLVKDSIGPNKLNVFSTFIERGLVDPYLIKFGDQFIERTDLSL